ncbi:MULTISPECIES: ABC transporter permease [Micromonospora]|jgi:simple sugar transport system permease protein|uniref:ABC transporter permease n=1 Tax=Micromonospora zamorensis TaxID=709883 RepID=A0ABZ1PA40_9ACTN|nr:MULTISPECIES: ABC transporter permease [Micromonospora]MBQ0982043.1 ABC transporter permease [Micromonospora sp. M61]MBQ1040536.1 ABC transporter permease [Micromonospora sp. C81]TQJ20287.1 nucleoside ABC transporter membrane protein [Micromonospora sp. A202]WSK46477.1 ABC transporter permease [Micromonospora zamorensis]WTI19639.1 ABC transporter permease [Micromonospora zamorensis]
MSTMAVPDIAVAPVDEGFWTRSRKVGLTLLGLGLLAAVLFGALATNQQARFTLSDDAAGAALKINGTIGAILFGIIAIAAGAALLAGVPKRWFITVLGIGLVGFVLSFLCWQVSAAPAGQNFMPLVNIIRGTFILALPLIFGALAGVLCERSGVVNVAIEGQLLMGAFSGALFGSISGSVWVGLVAAALGGAFISLLLAVFAIRYLVDQVVMGIVLNLLAVGVTGFLYERLMQTDAAKYNSAPRFSNWEIPLLKDIPVLGPALFRGNIFLYLGLLLVLVIHIGLFRTRWGLRTRSVGEHPIAADTLGVKVLRVRYRNVLLAGVVAGIGGASYTLALYSFTKNMIGGKGFIALAALIFGRWNPTGALLAALFFGFADQLATYLGAISSSIPSQFLAMLPYLATILAVAGLVGRVRAPAADGKPYIKG